MLFWLESILFNKEPTYSEFQHLTYPNIFINHYTLLLKSCTLQFLKHRYQYWMTLPIVFIQIILLKSCMVAIIRNW